MEKLKKGEPVSEQEAVRDRGLTEYRKLVKTALDNGDESVKVAYYEKYNADPQGMDAPVFGSVNTTSSFSPQDDYNYEDIHNS
jgi:hypothetical protein